MRKWNRTDAPHTDIMEALRKAGAVVCSLSNVGRGCPRGLESCDGRVHEGVAGENSHLKDELPGTSDF
jgi:hypothetical protein